MRLQVPLGHCEAVLGQLSGWFPGRREELMRLAERCQIGLQLDVKPIRNRHTREQQGAYWASLHEFGAHLGYRPTETEQYLHPVICSAAFGVADERRITCRGQSYTWPVPAETSSKDRDGNVRDVDTYTTLIETLIQTAAEHGYVIEIHRRPD